jgi:hypothetical protein
MLRCSSLLRYVDLILVSLFSVCSQLRLMFTVLPHFILTYTARFGVIGSPQVYKLCAEGKQRTAAPTKTNTSKTFFEVCILLRMGMDFVGYVIGIKYNTFKKLLVAIDGTLKSQYI